MRVRSKTLAEIAGGDGDLRIEGDPGTRVSDIVYDSRHVRAGSLFVALRGTYFDGHQFVDEAVSRGAAAVMVETQPPPGTPAIVAPNTRAALARIAAAFFDWPSHDLHVVGITGTDGKTTTSYLVDAILRAAGFRTGLVGTVSVRIGNAVVEHETRQTTPESVEIQRYLRQMVEQGCSWAILEATSHGLDLHRLDHVRFQIGAVTNITLEHLEHHKTVAAYRRAKGILFERVGAASGVAVINLDDEGARAMIPFAKGAQILTYSTEGEADISAHAITSSVSGSRFRIRAGEEEVDIALPLVGRFNVSNALCAAGVAMAAEVDLATVAQALERAPVVPGRMMSVEAGQPFSVIVDYAHTPDSMSKVLTLLRNLNPSGRLIAVSGSAGERDRVKRPMQGEVSAKLADISIFTSEDPRFEDPDQIIEEIAAGATQAGAERGKDFFCITDRAEAVRLALSLARPGDCVALLGKGHERSIIWGFEKRPWDEAQVARTILEEMGFRKDTEP
jgi:UDP-N-acetylmuramoyl-L-alanyl-D-glutamate--2,6-diaminopimelate ligase